MARFKLLGGVAHNLADSIISATNPEFLENIEHLLDGKPGSYELDLLAGKIEPADIDEEVVERMAGYYRKWLSSETGKLGISSVDVDSVFIKIAYTPGKSFGGHYTCSVSIKVKGKEYAGNAMSSYA